MLRQTVVEVFLHALCLTPHQPCAAQLYICWLRHLKAHDSSMCSIIYPLLRHLLGCVLQKTHFRLVEHFSSTQALCIPYCTCLVLCCAALCSACAEVPCAVSHAVLRCAASCAVICHDVPCSPQHLQYKQYCTSCSSVFGL